jgi:copper chaperone CopZ
MKTTVYCPDLECDSCNKIITKALRTIEVTPVSFTNDSLEVEYDNNKTSIKTILATIRSKGFRANTEPFERKTVQERYRDFRENKHKYAVEYAMLKYSAGTFVLLIALHALAYFAFFKTITNFLPQYGWWLFYLDLAIVSIGAAMWHIQSYRPKVTMMVGMMIGMTFGMQTGMMLGTILGATNGLFWGSLIGMLLAVSVGVVNGRCCGIMGMLEGAMAGLMGGLMGAMIGMMLSVDHILWLMPFFFAINLAIMWGLSYMLYEEAVEEKHVTAEPIPFLTFAACCAIATTVLTACIVYGWKTGLAALSVT